MSLIERLTFIPRKIRDGAAVSLSHCMSGSVTRYPFSVLQPAVVHLQGQETTIQVREGQSYGRSNKQHNLCAYIFSCT